MHMATHNDVDDNQLPYVCDICKKRFATNQFLVTHRFRHRTKACTNDVKLESAIKESLNNKVSYLGISIFELRGNLCLILLICFFTN